MRIPFSKVYRAFPELDEFTDAECQGFVQMAQREKAVALLATAMGAVVCSLLTGIVVAFGTGSILASVFDAPERSPRGDVRFGVFFAVIGAAGVLSAALVGLLIRDLWIRWAITRRLRIARCLRCSYSLLGLSVIDGRVQCPECGSSTRLSDRGLTPADILAGARELILRDGVA